MKMTYDTVRDAVMALGKSDLLKLRDELDALDSTLLIESDDSRMMRPDMMDEEVFAELERRREEAERNPSVLVTWEVAEKQWRELLK